MQGKKMNRNYFFAPHFFAICIWSCWLPLALSRAEPLDGKLIGEFKLTDVRGKVTALSEFRESDVLVVAFLGTECPLAKLYAPKLAKLEQEYRTRGVAFLSINSNAQDSLA